MSTFLQLSPLNNIHVLALVIFTRVSTCFLSVGVKSRTYFIYFLLSLYIHRGSVAQNLLLNSLISRQCNPQRFFVNIWHIVRGGGVLYSAAVYMSTLELTACTFWQGSHSRIHLLQSYSKYTRHILNVVSTKKKNTFIRPLLYNLFRGQKAQIPNCFKTGRLATVSRNMETWEYSFPSYPFAPVRHENPNLMGTWHLHSLWFRRPIELSRWNLPQPVKFAIYEILHSFTFENGRFRFEYQFWVTFFAIHDSYPYTLTAKRANGSNSFSTKIDYTKACILCCMYVNYDWNNSTVKTVLQCMCLDGVGVTRACTYSGCPVFPTHYTSPLLRDSIIRKCVEDVRSSQCQ